MNFSSIVLIGAAALAWLFWQFVVSKSLTAMSRDAAWSEIAVMRRLMPPRPGNREGRCLFD